MKPRHLGQSLTEIALILMLIAVIAVASLSLFGEQISEALFGASDQLESTVIQSADPGDLSAFNQWTSWQDDQDGWENEAGRFAKLGKDKATLLAQATGSDYVINVNNLQLQKGNRYGLLFRANAQTPITGYMLYVKHSRRGNINVRIQRWEKGRNRGTIARGRIKKADLSSANLKLMVKGDTFSAYVNNQKAVVGRDSTYASGTIGLHAPKNTTMTVGNIVVTQGN